MSTVGEGEELKTALSLFLSDIDFNKILKDNPEFTMQLCGGCSKLFRDMVSIALALDLLLSC